MKYILIIALMCSTLNAQEYSKVALVQSPGSLEDGFSIGLQYEHQNNTVYYGTEFYYFPELNDITYTHLIGRFGFNPQITSTRNVRTYFGPRIGAIFRDSNTYALLGGELGFDIFLDEIFDIFPDNMFIGLSGASDLRADSKIWGEDSFTVNSGFIRTGIKF